MKIKGKMTPEDIGKAVEQTSLELEREGVASELRLRFRLSLEELLLLYKDEAGETAPFTVVCRKRHGDLFVLLSVSGEQMDPFKKESPILDRLAQEFDVQPEWDYRNGLNTVTFRFLLYNTAFKNYAFAWHYVRTQRKLLYTSVLLQFGSVVLGIVAPVLSARIVTNYMENKALRVIAVAAVLFGVQALKNLLLVACNKGYNKVYTSMFSELEDDLIRGALRIKNQCLDEMGSGLFIQRLTGDTNRMATGFGRIADMIAQAVNYIGILLAMLYIGPIIFALTLVIFTAQSVLEIMRTRRLCRDDRIYRTANEHFSGFIGEMVRGAKDVKQLCSEETFCAESKKRVTDANEKKLIMQGNSWNMKLVRWDVGEFGTFVFITILALALAGGYFPATTILVLYNYYSSLDVRAITLAGEFMEYVKDFNLSVERVCALINSPEFPKEHFGKKELTDPHGEITFDRVTFGYRSRDPLEAPRPVLKDMSFTVHAGEMVALVGKSGCGKTTVLNLLCRLYDPQSGKIFFDGEDTRMLTKEALRENMTVVNQNPYIFNMTIRENLKLAKADMTEKEMRHVCEMACIDQDIEDMPQGYDTLIGEGGVNLSGGQKQRLAIARSLLKDYRIILFDEATSALDNVTQAKIQKAIDSITEGRTVILIAHRLSTVIHADRIMYMEDGKILAEGRHEELLKSCEPYRLLYQEEGKGRMESALLP